MKKVIIAVLVGALLFCGCATIKGWFCSPAADAVAVATQALAQATEVQSFLMSVPATEDTLAMLAGLRLAIPILNSVRQGICVASDQLENAVNVAKGNEVLAMKKMGFKRK